MSQNLAFCNTYTLRNHTVLTHLDKYTPSLLKGEVIYVRGKVSRVFKNNNNGKLTILGADTLLGKQIEVECDMVVLSMAVVPSPGIQELGRKLKIQMDSHGFLSEAHPKLRPVETLTAGFYLAGCAQAPKDIPDVVAQASGAASKVFALFSQEKLSHEPVVATVWQPVPMAPLNWIPSGRSPG